MSLYIDKDIRNVFLSWHIGYKGNLRSPVHNTYEGRTDCNHLIASLLLRLGVHKCLCDTTMDVLNGFTEDSKLFEQTRHRGSVQMQSAYLLL